MTRNGAEEYITAIRTRYWAAGKTETGRILDEACQTTGFHRKAMIRLLRGTRARVQPAARRPKYGAHLIEPLVVAWEALGRPCATRLEAFIPELIPALERHGELQLPDERRIGLSSASISKGVHTRLPAPTYAFASTIAAIGTESATNRCCSGLTPRERLARQFSRVTSARRIMAGMGQR